jgi:glycosyltransferase involved in cell wall biosynthesis
MSNVNLKISCTIITKNEADRITRTIRSVMPLVDEVLVVDSGSSDDTVKICRSLGAKVLHNDWHGYGPQKRFCEDKACHDWILNIDADEVLTDELAREIASLVANGEPPLKGYGFRFSKVYPHHKKPLPLADYQTCLRLYDRRFMRYSRSLVHDSVDPKGHQTGMLKNIVYHYSYRSLEDLRAKLDGYTSLQSKEIKKPLWLLYLRKFTEYPLQFFNYFFLRGYWLGGIYGARVTHVIAGSKLSRINKFIQAKRHKS